MKAKRSVILLITSILSLAYLAYVIISLAGAFADTTGEAQLGAALATALVLPHLIAIALGTLFCWLGYGLRNKWFVLVGAILFCVALALFFFYFMFTVPLIVLGFIGFVNQGKLCNSAVLNNTQTADTANIKEETENKN